MTEEEQTWNTIEMLHSVLYWMDEQNVDCEQTRNYLLNRMNALFSPAMQVKLALKVLHARCEQIAASNAYRNSVNVN